MLERDRGEWGGGGKLPGYSIICAVYARTHPIGVLLVGRSSGTRSSNTGSGRQMFWKRVGEGEGG